MLRRQPPTTCKPVVLEDIGVAARVGVWNARLQEELLPIERGHMDY